MGVDVLIEVWVAMCHRDVDVGQLDLVVVPKMLVLLLIQDDVPNLGVIPMLRTSPEEQRMMSSRLRLEVSHVGSSNLL